MAAVLAAVVVMAVVVAAMLAAMVAVIVTVVVMIAADVGIVVETAVQKCLHSAVGVAGSAAVELNTGLSQSVLSAGADAAADENVHPVGQQETGQSAVAAAVGIDDPGVDDGAVFHFIDLELFGVTKVLENGSVLISNCDFHAG